MRIELLPGFGKSVLVKETQLHLAQKEQSKLMEQLQNAKSQKSKP